MTTEQPSGPASGASSEASSGGEGLTCRELIGSLMDYLDGVLTDKEMASMQEHLRLCPSCRNYLESYVQTVRLTKAELRKADAAMPVLPEELVRHIHKAMDTAG